MVENIWLCRIQQAAKAAITQDGKKKVHYKFPTGEQMVEEYSLETKVLLRRAWKRDNPIRGGEWEVEVGDPEGQLNQLDNVGIKESVGEPYVTRRITKTSLEWRIRNLPYPLETYSVTADTDNDCLTVRTTNKKYFKRLIVPELQRVGLRPQQASIDLAHKYQTLIITYKKPNEVFKMEKAVLEELEGVQTIKNGDLPCNPS